MHRTLIALAALLAGGLSAFAGESLPLTTLNRLKQGTVFIRVEDAGVQGSGSGFLFEKRDDVGYIVTNSHVVISRGRKASRLSVVFHSGTKQEMVLRGAVVAYDPDRDLAILEVKSKQLPQIVDSSKEVKLQETLPVYIVGYPFGTMLATARKNPAVTLSQGSVSSIRRDEFDRVITVQIDGSINPGNSGGPIVTAEGDLVGVAVATIRGTQIGLAIPTQQLKEMLLGRIQSISFTQVETTQTSVTYRVSGKVIDPMGSLRKVSIFLAPKGNIQLQSKPDEHGLFRRFSTTAVEHPLRVQAGALVGTIAVKLNPKVEPLFVFQPVFTRADGKTILMQPGELQVKRPISFARPRDSGRSSQPEGNDDLFHTEPVKPKPSDRLVAGAPYAVGDLKVVKLSLDAGKIATRLVWSTDGKHLFVLSRNGVLRKLQLPQFREVLVLEMGTTCSFLGQSKEGLVVVQDSQQNVCVVEEQSLAVQREVRVGGANTMACGVGSSWGFVPERGTIVAVDLKAGKVVAEIDVRALGQSPRKTGPLGLPPHDVRFMRMTPDGKYLFICSGERLHRVSVDAQRLVLQESGPRIGQNPQGIEISQDSNYVAMPSGGGNYPVDGHPNVGYGTYIYSVRNLQSPRIGIKSGAYPRCLALDATGRKIYAQNFEKQLIVFNVGGVKVGEYALSRRGDQLRQFLVHPSGNKLCVLTGSELFFVRVPE